MSVRRWSSGLALVLLVAALLVPALGSAADATAVSLAVARAAMAAGASLALAAGRPSLALAGLGGVAAYTSAVASLHGWPVLGAVAAGIAAAAVASAVLGLVGTRLSAPAFLALTLVATLAGGALLDALPDLLGGASGLSPVPPLEVPLGGGDRLTFNPTGMLHVVVALCGLAVVGAGALLAALPGARWRAIGGDRSRSAAAGLRPVRGQTLALMVAGLLAGLGGALGVHVSGVASPAAFSADAAVAPLLAALLAGRGGPGLAALIAGAFAMLDLRILPALGWSGPPGAEALATGALAALTLLALPVLLRRGRRRGEAAVLPVAGGADAPWPAMAPRGGPSGLRVVGLPLVPGRGAAPLGTLDLDVPAGAVQGLVGPNGAGKSTALAAIAARRGGGGAGVAPAVLMPQSGGGWPGTTVEETLRLAAGAGGRSRAEARRAAAEWSSRLGLAGVGGALCETLSHGVRRRVELARVLLLRPAVLLCDEPLAGLGEADRELVLACLRAAAASGVTLVVAEHDHASLRRLAGAVTELQRSDAAGVAPGAAPA
jgi:branched-chain amino acid transport system permease protein